MKALKMFDIHTKSLDGVTQQTTIGAIVTLISSVVVLMLLFSELRLYTTTELVSRMYPDNGVGRSSESVRLHFDVEFPEIDCELIKFSQEVTRGQTHILEEEQHAEIKREAMVHPDKVGKFGCWVHGSLLTDKVGGHFIFKVTPTERRMTAEDKERMTKELEAAGITQENSKQMASQIIQVLPPLKHNIRHIMFLPAEGPGADKDGALLSERKKNMARRNNRSRVRDKTARGLLYNDKKFGLEQEKTLFETAMDVESGKGLKHYMLQVVPTHYKSRRGPKYDQLLNQYSVTQKVIDTSLISHGGVIQLAGQSFSDTYGLVFSYDFYPVKLTLEERKESFLEFLANLVGIVGGVITVINLVGMTVGAGVKAVIGKKD
jgi:hypothetical protein